MWRGESHFSQKWRLANVGESGEYSVNGLANVGEFGESAQHGSANVGEFGANTQPKSSQYVKHKTFLNVIFCFKVKEKPLAKVYEVRN
jgi:hypothetical protein